MGNENKRLRWNDVKVLELLAGTPIRLFEICLMQDRIWQNNKRKSAFWN